MFPALVQKSIKETCKSLWSFELCIARYKKDVYTESLRFTNLCV